MMIIMIVMGIVVVFVRILQMLIATEKNSLLHFVLT